MAKSSFFKDGGADSGTFASLDSKLAAAEASKVAAEAAKVAAEQAETDAQTAEANALSHANTALQNQQSTSAHVTQTTNNATGAQQSATAAQSSEDDARKLAVEPEDSQYALSNGTIGYSALHYSEKADDSAVSAAASVVTAAGHVSTASGHATTAGGHASTASGHAATATTKATDATASAAAALQSEQNAAQSETNAAQSANTASGHEANASTSENNSANSAQAAGSSASAATTSANTASGHATNSGNSATASANSATASSNSAGSAASAQTAAEAARDSALAALDSFDDRYLGVKSSDPTLDNDGNSLVSGALYFSSADTSMKVYDGSQWLNAYASLSGALVANQNLSDLNNAGTARTNLGLASVAASGAYGDLTGAPSLSSYITNNVSGDFTVDSGTLFVDASTNRVGINLGSGVSPTVPLNVAGTARFQSTTSAGQMLELTNYSGVSKFYRANGRLEFQAGNNSNDQLILGNTGGLTFGGNDVLTSASTIDAATLDGIDSTSFLRSDADDSVSANISFGDNNKAIFGAGSDLQIYHDGSHSYIHEVGTGDLRLKVNDLTVQSTNGSYMMRGVTNGAVSLYYSNFPKLDTTSTGIAIAGNITVSGTVDGRDVAADGTKLDGVATGATNVSSLTDLSISDGSNGQALKTDGSGNFSFGDVATSTAWTDITSKPTTISGFGITDAFDGAYGSLTGTPTIPTNNNQLTNGAGYITSANGGNATTLDGIDSGSFLRSDATDTTTGYLTVDNHFRVQNAGVSGQGDNNTHFNYNNAGTNYIRGTNTYINSASQITKTMTLGTQLALVADNYGRGLFGLYSATRYQHVWSMGTAYKTNDSGTSYGNMYGLTFTHTNIGTGTNQAISGLSHQLQLRMNGTLHAAIGSGIWTSGNITAYSDRAVKTNLEIIPNALDKVCQLNGYTYDRTDYEVDPVTGEMPETRQAGVVAQEVEAVLPEVVSGEDGNKAVAYGNMVSILIEAIKELKAEIEELKKG